MRSTTNDLESIKHDIYFMDQNRRSWILFAIAVVIFGIMFSEKSMACRVKTNSVDFHVNETSGSGWTVTSTVPIGSPTYVRVKWEAYGPDDDDFKIYIYRRPSMSLIRWTTADPTAREKIFAITGLTSADCYYLRAKVKREGTSLVQSNQITWSEVVGVQRVHCNGVTSYTNSPDANETTLVGKGGSGSTITIYAYRDPSCAYYWPSNKPTWSGGATAVPGDPWIATFPISTASATSSGSTVTATCGTSSKAIKIVVVELEFNNSTIPSIGESDDSDDYFLRGYEANDVNIFYDFLPTGISPNSVKLFFRCPPYTIVREIDLPTTGGSDLRAQCNIPSQNAEDYPGWDYRIKLQMVKGTQTITSDQNSVTDLLYKHRPVVYVHENELTGPQDVNSMLSFADLYSSLITRVASSELQFTDLSSYDTTSHFQNLADNMRQVNERPNVIYCRGIEQSDYIFLQYWHFEPSSSIPETAGIWHEGDWEMFQVAVEPNTTDEELQPTSVTASQHYYGQTIRWKETGNGPGSQDQDYVGKSGNRPKIYIALNSHATYFRQGYFKTRSGGENHGDQYDSAPNVFPILDDETGSDSYSYTLQIFHNNMISHWKGRWGIYGIPGVPHDDGPRSPVYREVHSTPHIQMWTDPKGFNNEYRKRNTYPSGAYSHPETNIP